METRSIRGSPAKCSGFRARFWHLLAVLPLGCQPAADRAGDHAPDRVVLVSIDTLRADHVGCYGATRAHTPTLDTVAREGVRFEVAVSPAPLTLPAHASLMTGLDPPAHGVRHNSVHRLADDIPVLAEQLGSAGYTSAGFVGSLVLDRRFGLARGFDVYDDRMEGRSAGTVGYAERRADRVVDAALAWLEGAPPRFFLWIHFYDPHNAYAPPPGFAAAFPSHPYAGEIAFADAQLGRLLDGLRVRFGDEGSLVVVTSDHGESLGEHGELTHSYGIYDATQRVPLLLRGPGLPRGRVVEVPVRLIDVAPTLIALTGAEPLRDAAGRDLLPLLRGVDEAERVAYVETLATQLDFGWSALQGVRSAGFKYIRAPRPELYDLARDPDETRNLAEDQPEIVARLDAELEAHLAGARAPAPSVQLSEAERAKLRRLGYVVPSDPRPAAREPGPDPKDEIGLLKRLARAESSMERGRADEALDALRDLADPAPGVSALRAAIAFNAGAHALAETDARRVLAVEPGRSDVWVVLGQTLEAQGDAAGALDAYASATAVDPGLVKAWQGLARLNAQRGDVAAANAAWQKLQQIETEAPW